MKRLLLPLLAAIALPTATYGLDVNYLNSLNRGGAFTYGSGFGASSMICTAYKTGSIKKKVALKITSNLLLKIPKSMPEYFVGWNEGLEGRDEKCEIFKF